MERDRLIGLDGLRGIAAVAVLAYHVLDTYGTNGFLAVDFFFMLSGYVMARTYEKRLADRGAAGRFLVGRIAKLWPTMAIASLITVPWLWLRMPDQAPLITLANLFLLPTPSSFGLYILNPPAWSILYELVANAVHAAVLGRLSQRQLAAVAALLAGLLVWTAHAHGMNFVTNDNVLGLGLVRVLCPYVIGIVLYRWWRDRPPVALPAQAIWAAMPVYFVAGSLWWNGSWLPDTLFVLLLCPLMIAGGLAMKGEGRFARMAGFWGAVSFPLYAIHGPLLIVMRPAGVPLPVQFAVCLAAGIAFTHGLRPVNAWVGKRLAGLAPPAATSTNAQAA